VHGISPGWVALSAAAVCMLPGVGVVDVRTFEAVTSFGTFFYVAGLLGMVSLVEDSGLAGTIGAAARDWLPLAPGAPATSFAALVAGASAVGLVTTHPGVPAVLGPIAPSLAEASGLPLEAVLMTQVVGFATLLLPYQSAPIMVAVQLAGIRLAAATRLSLLLGSLTLLVLVPLDYAWWQYLSYLD
jgi:di/tricarboxylate transporter